MPPDERTEGLFKIDGHRLPYLQHGDLHKIGALCFQQPRAPVCVECDELGPADCFRQAAGQNAFSTLAKYSVSFLPAGFKPWPSFSGCGLLAHAKIKPLPE